MPEKYLQGLLFLIIKSSAKLSNKFRSFVLLKEPTKKSQKSTEKIESKTLRSHERNIKDSVVF
ncbi:MAG: hypothetical protein CVT92_13955 [Bacteroidetes bacterium HGW-Bacteroidetes-1]|nr:MAG: hypothetical protein CVT92_13955 [Bacteroidetes bacterium HGW-Bacteroidetes-1]